MTSLRFSDRSLITSKTFSIMSGIKCSLGLCGQASRLASRSRSTSSFATAWTFAARQVSSNSIRALEDRDTTSSSPSSREEARQRAWYLKDEDTPSHPTAGPSTRPLPRQPKFTRYDPQSTTAEISTGNDAARPLPSDAPPHFASLHELLTTSELLEPSSVRFLYTPAAEPGPDASLTRVTRRWGPGIRRWAANDQSEGGAMPGGRTDGRETRPLFGDVGATWEWVVVAQVRGRGKGVVARAERMIRLWVSRSSLCRRTWLTPSAAR